MSIKPVLLFPVLAFLMAGCHDACAQEVLDLAKAARERAVAGEPKTGRVSGSFIGYEGMTFEALPLSLTLVSVAPRKVRYGASLVYEVKVKNAGSASLAFPWSAERIDEGVEPLHVILRLATKDGSGDDWFIGSSGIYGRQDALAASSG